MATNKFIGNNTLSNFVTNTGWMVSMPTQNSNNSVNNGWLSAEVKKSIADYVDSQWFTGMDRQLKIQELEQETIKKKQENLYKQWREDVKAELYQKSLDKQNPAGAAQAKEQWRLADLADMVRWYTQKTDWKELQWDDNKVVWDFLKANQNMIAPFASYMNGDQSAYDFAKMYGFDTNFDPVAEKKRWGWWRWSLVWDNAEWNDDIFWHFEATSYDDAGEWFWNKVGTFGLNTLKSAWNLGSDVVNVVANPFDTVNNLSKMVVWWLMNLTTLDDYLDPDGEWWINSANQVADGLWDYLVERYWGWDNIKNTLYTDPVGVVSDVASVIEWWAGIVKWATKAWAVWAAKVWLKNLSKNLDDVSRVSGNVSKVAHYADPFNEIMEWWWRVAKRWYNKAAPKISDAVDSFVWLDSKTKKSIQSNPYTNSTWKDVENYINENWLPERSQEVSKSLISDLSDAVKEDLKKYVDQFNETWPLYRTLKNGNYSVDLTSMKQKLDSFLEEQWVKIWEWWYLDFTDTAVTPTEASAIRRAYQWLTPNEAEPVSQYLRHRKGIDQLYNWENTKGTPWRDILKAMREMANDEAHAQIKPLESLDKLYAEQIWLINDATEWLVYRDKRKLWQYRDNFNQILKNMDTPNRARMKERLEKIIPWIEQKVEAINLMPKLIDNYYRPWKANKWLSSVSGMVWASIRGVPWALIWAGIWYWASKLYDLIKSKRWNSVVSNLSEEWKANLANIEQSIKNNQKLSAEQAEYLSRISEELKANKKLKEAQVTDILQRIATAEEWSELSVLDDVMKELKKIWANDELKEVSQIREWVVKEMGEWAEMDKYAQEFEAEKENIINEAADQRLPEFKKRIYQLQQEERRIWSVAWKKIWKNFEGKDFKNTQQTEWLRKKDKLIEEIWEYYNVDQFEAAEIYDRIERQASADDVGFSKSQASSKTAKYQVADDYVPTKDSTWKSLSKWQQEYFKWSKVVDKDGNLLRVYHWTHNDFTVFDRNKIGTNTNNKWIFGEWFYSTSKESFANMYAGKWYSKEWLEWKVMEWYVDIKNPFMRNDYKGETALEKLRKELWLGKNVIKLNKLDNMIHPLIEPKQSEKFRAALEKAGYDGVVFKYPEWWWDEIVTFYSNQFKNIDNLNPTKNEDIRFQKYWVAWQWEKGISATEWLNIRNFKNWKTVQELANQYWIDTKIVDSISTPEWQRAYGMYWDRLITLSKDLKEYTVPHELLHGVFDMVDSKRRTSILEWIQKKLNVDNVQAEEWLADSFSEYYRTGKFWTQWLAKWLVEKVKQFFYQVKSYIDWTYKNEKQIRQLFDDIIDWKIEWEYGVYSDPKFQQAWHGSKADFEKFDSSHMGEWAWSQAHWWGHYVTKNQDSAKIYAQWDSQTTYKWKTYNELFREWANTNNLEYLAAADVMSTLKRYDTIEEAFEHTHSIDDAKEAMYKQLKKENFKREWGYVYEAEIPDPIKKNTPTGKNYWEEQKVIPWSQVDKIMSKAKKVFTQEQYKEFEQMVDEWNFNWGKMISEDIYKALDRALWWEKEASKFLESLGYDWIHYNWWRDGEVFVIFNDDAIKIKNKEKVLQSI